MHAFVRFTLLDGTSASLGPGDLIGRASTAALVLDDARISEAHAMVSLRGAELKLLALRGRFRVDGQPQSSVALQRGQLVTFASGLDLAVTEVVLPPDLVALDGDGLPSIVLHGSSSLFAGPPPRVVPRHEPEADAHIWSVGERWRVAVGDGEAREIGVGESFVLQGRSFRLALLRMERAGVDATQQDEALAAPLHLVTDFDTVQIRRGDGPPILIGGISARIVAMLAEAGSAVEWESVARGIWPADNDRGSLRRRFDVALARLRTRLRSSGLRTDLVAANGAGLIELLRYPGDVVTVRD